MGRIGQTGTAGRRLPSRWCLRQPPAVCKRGRRQREGPCDTRPAAGPPPRPPGARHPPWVVLRTPRAADFLRIAHCAAGPTHVAPNAASDSR
eukprot:299320-Prymnesium_polylepis.2